MNEINNDQLVKIAKVESILPLYKDGVLAKNIELVQLEELGFDIVVGKDLFHIGDMVVYIMPDACISDTLLFESYIRPGGDENKSMLGKVDGKPRRIRAKKFNFTKGDSADSVYSNGIIIHSHNAVLLRALFEGWKDVITESEYDQILNSLADKQVSGIDVSNALCQILGVSKYTQTESQSAGGSQYLNQQDNFPSDVYKTDETNINLVWGHIEKNIKYPVHLIGTEKIDGSSISIGHSPSMPNGFIASRNKTIPIRIKRPVGVRRKTFIEKLLFWKNVDLHVYQEFNNNDKFVMHGKPYLDILNIIHENTGQYIVLRGELHGRTCKGSGNKNNPASKFEDGIKFFGIDIFDSNGRIVKQPFSVLQDFAEVHKIQTVSMFINQSFSSKDEIQKVCNDVLEQYKPIEGIVLSTLDGKFSCKYMDNNYDSTK